MTEKIAGVLGFDQSIARNGAILHCRGKASPVFQERIQPDYRRTDSDHTFRHELASLFFLSLFNEETHPQLIEMVVAHHKSVKKDTRLKGILDLEDNVEDVFALHKSQWKSWSEDALRLL
ncbi:MAG: CRISPR-associated endonuclease Cas3'' [Bacteroidales bacterium]|nr:CRISPR-associated endonuclease Cas3'' [Bacteroidales bacterium]